VALATALPADQAAARAGQKAGTSAPQAVPLGVDPPLSSPGIKPLSPEILHLLSSVTADPAPPAIIRNSHYWISNENHHAVWHPKVSGIGGVLLGVGTDQNYLLAGWSGADLLLLMDFDTKIPLLHQIYGLFFKNSATPERFHQRWSSVHEQESWELIRKGLAQDKPRLARKLLKIFKVTRPLIWYRLARVKKQHRKLGIATFMDDQAQYDHLRGLWQQGRVLPVRGDLTGKITMRQLSRVLRVAGLQMGVLYLSNAEQYFNYGPSFRRNILEIPWADKSMALRTLAWGCHGLISAAEMYHYNHQDGRNFSAWMAHSLIKSAGRMLFRKTASGVKGVSVLERSPPSSRRAPVLAPAMLPSKP